MDLLPRITPPSWMNKCQPWLGNNEKKFVALEALVTGLTNKEVAEHLLGLKKRSLSPGWQDHGSGLSDFTIPKKYQ